MILKDTLVVRRSRGGGLIKEGYNRALLGWQVRGFTYGDVEYFKIVLAITSYLCHREPRSCRVGMLELTP